MELVELSFKFWKDLCSGEDMREVLNTSQLYRDRSLNFITLPYLLLIYFC